MNTKRALSILVLAVLALSVALYLGACGDSGGGGGTSPDEAAAQASAVSGAVQLSETIGMSAGIAEDSVATTGYAPGKGGTIDTRAIADIDPRLKDVVDKMMAQLQKPAVRNAVSKARSKTMSSAPLSAATFSTTCSPTGEYTITVDSVATGPTTTTNTLTVTFNHCKDDFLYDDLHGYITGTHVFDSAGYESVDLTMNLTDTQYSDAFVTVSDIFVMDGTFSSINNNNASGTNSAKGSFSWRIPTGGGNIIYSFNFGSGGNPVRDEWTDTNPGGYGTKTHMGNGVFGYSLSMPGMQTVSLNVTLTDLIHSVTSSVDGLSESISGSVSISWTPDLSDYGCKSGTFTITTTSPILKASQYACPTSGTVKINDATIQYGNPAPYGVTVSAGGESVTFSNCYEFISRGSGGVCR